MSKSEMTEWRHDQSARFVNKVLRSLHTYKSLDANQMQIYTDAYLSGRLESQFMQKSIQSGRSKITDFNPNGSKSSREGTRHEQVSVLSEYEIKSMNDENIDDETEEKLALINNLIDRMYISSAVMETTLNRSGQVSNR